MIEGEHDTPKLTFPAVWQQAWGRGGHNYAHKATKKKKNTEQWEQNIVRRHTSSSFIGFIKGLFGMTPTQADLLHLEALLHCSGALPDEVRLKDEHYFMSIGQINVFTWGKVQEM